MPAFGSLILVGALTGATGSLVGLGGGVLLVPVLHVLLALDLRAAVASSLVTVAVGATFASIGNLRRGRPNVKLAGFMGALTAVGALLGGIVARSLSSAEVSGLFSTTLVVLGLVVVARANRRNLLPADVGVRSRFSGLVREGGKAFAYRPRRLPVAAGFALLAGVLSGVLGIGGGIVHVPVLNSFCAVPIRVAAATSTLIVGPSSAVSALVYAFAGDVPWSLMTPLCLGGVVGSALGVRLTDRLPARVLKGLLATILFGVVALMAFGMVTT